MDLRCYILKYVFFLQYMKYKERDSYAVDL